MRLIALVPVLALLTACATEAGIERRWDAWVADHQSCETVDDCGVVYPGCPLGCTEAVSAEAVEEGQALADRLIRRWEAGGRACAYDCLPEAPLECVQGACTFGERTDTGF